MIETGFSGSLGIKGAVGIEKCALDCQIETLHALEGGLQVGFEIESIMMMTGDNPCGGNDVTLSFRNRQDVGCFGPFAGLVGHRLTAFLGNYMTAVQIEFRKIQVVLDGQNALFPHRF